MRAARVAETAAETMAATAGARVVVARVVAGKAVASRAGLVAATGAVAEARVAGLVDMAVARAALATVGAREEAARVEAKEAAAFVEVMGSEEVGKVAVERAEQEDAMAEVARASERPEVIQVKFNNTHIFTSLLQIRRGASVGPVRKSDVKSGRYIML